MLPPRPRPFTTADRLSTWRAAGPTADHLTTWRAAGPTADRLTTCRAAGPTADHLTTWRAAGPTADHLEGRRADRRPTDHLEGRRARPPAPNMATSRPRTWQPEQPPNVETTEPRPAKPAAPERRNPDRGKFWSGAQGEPITSVFMVGLTRCSADPYRSFVAIEPRT